MLTDRRGPVRPMEMKMTHTIKVNGKSVKIGKNSAETQRNIIAAQDPAGTAFANAAWARFLAKVEAAKARR